MEKVRKESGVILRKYFKILISLLFGWALFELGSLGYEALRESVSLTGFSSIILLSAIMIFLGLMCSFFGFIYVIRRL